MEKVVFYREWLLLPKAEFNVLTMIAEQGGTFSGNYTIYIEVDENTYYGEVTIE